PARDLDQRVLKAAGPGFRIALDERGQTCTTADLAKRFRAWDQDGTNEIQFLVGGPDGHSETIRKEADWLWSLSPLTLQRDLALLVLMEQLYRVQSILSGSPYHRA
ncbi:MAG: 23S rRNA (pseudouridine(1915)-N(3))-methyltransferase RlmH, partial [Verrucomicrobiota bacterium]